MFLAEWCWLRPPARNLYRSWYWEKILQQSNTSHNEEFPILRPGFYQQKFLGHAASVNLVVGEKVRSCEVGRGYSKIESLCSAAIGRNQNPWRGGSRPLAAALVCCQLTAAASPRASQVPGELTVCCPVHTCVATQPRLWCACYNMDSGVWGPGFSHFLSRIYL